MARQKRAWASVSQACAAAKSATGRSLKKRVRRPGTEATWSGRSRGELGEAGGEAVGQLGEALVGAGVQLAQGRQPGGDRQRVAREGARLVDVAGRGDPLHQLARPGEGGRRKAAAEHLAEDVRSGSTP